MSLGAADTSVCATLRQISTGGLQTLPTKIV